MYLNRLAQMRAQRQWQAEQALARQRVGETMRHNLAPEGRPSSQMQLLQAYQQAGPEQREAMAKLFGQGTTINMPQAITQTEAEQYPQTESLITNLEALDTLGEKGVDLSGFSGIWTEVKAEPTGCYGRLV